MEWPIGHGEVQIILHFAFCIMQFAIKYFNFAEADVKITRTSSIYILLLLFILSSCGTDSKSSGTGSLGFSLEFQKPNAAETKAIISRAPTGDPCTDYTISTIRGTLYDASNTVIATGGPWQCSAHQGAFTEVPVGSNYTAVFEGIVAGSVAWRGQATNQSVVKNQTTTISSPVPMSYAGPSDPTPPTVIQATPSHYQGNIPVTASIAVTFSEEMSGVTIDANSFVVLAGTTAVSGTVTYNAATRTATFKPSSNLAYSTIYTFAITTAVKDLAQNSLSANYTTGFTTVAAPVAAPAAPVLASATSGDGQVTLAWNASADATSYNVYWATAGGVTKSSTKLSSVTSPYNHTSLTNGTKYYYVVTAVNANGESTVSNEMSATPASSGSAPPAPANVSAAAGDGQVTINWTSVSNATSYNIYWSTTTGVTKTNGTKLTNVARPYTHTGRTNNTTVYYIVTATNIAGESTASSQVSATPAVINGIIQLPKTGQTTSYAAGDDGDLQLGVAWPNPRFTNPDGTIPVSASTVMDHLTGLMWTKDSYAPGPVSCPTGTRMNWQNALDYVACLNTNSYLGYADWRLPNVLELRSLLNYGQPYPYIWLMSQGFVNVKTDYYWSSTTWNAFTTSAWWVNMYNGDVNTDNYYDSTSHTINNKIEASRYCWPVRTGGPGTISLPKTGQIVSYAAGDDGNLQTGVAWPSPRFTNSDGTAPINGNVIIDKLTGFMWPKDGSLSGATTCGSLTAISWVNMLNFVACLNTNNYLGYNDWRQPNQNELASILNVGQYDDATWLITQGFSNVVSAGYFSSTTSAINTNNTQFVNLGSSAWMMNALPKNPAIDAYQFIFPVRVGQNTATTPPSTPVVSSISPVNNSTSIALASAITITFSKPMLASTINTTNITVSNGVGNIAGTISLNGSNTTATFTPSANLAYSTTYTITVTTGVKDSVSNALASNFTASFTTIAQSGVQVTW